MKAASLQSQKNMHAVPNATPSPPHITIFMCGDVMTGRGIDQVLPYPSNPHLHEPYIKDARDYVELAERVHGPISQPIDFTYVWGDALKEWERLAPDVRMINLETSITQHDAYWKGKDIHYRMHPANIPCLTVAKIDCCALANNHTLDWGYRGLEETLETLEMTPVKVAGAGRNIQEAEAPAVIEVAEKGRVIVFACGLETSGIPPSWAATEMKPGVNLLQGLSEASIRHLQTHVQKMKRHRDIVVVSIHWGGNWGYDISQAQKVFAHKLIDEAAIDVIHGHSSHHVKGIEVYKNKPIIYGCGDFITDYEGIGGHKAYRGDLTLMCFTCFEPLTGDLMGCQMTPMRMKRFKLNRASQSEALWLYDTLNREGEQFGTRVTLTQDRTFTLHWDDHR